jgi:two-component system, LytTR family, sensor histidine kinase AlgZ
VSGAKPTEPAAAWPIIRGALSGGSPQVRRVVRLVAVFALLMITLQIWDSRDGAGTAGVAEFMSVTLGICGVAMLGLARALHLSMEDIASADASNDAPGVARVLMALPAVGFVAGVALAGATVLMVMRGLLGTELPLAVGGVALYGTLLAVAAATVLRSTRTLFEFAGRHARAAADHRAAATAARLDALHARMNPHVLFNALNTVASLVRSNPPAAERVVETLSDVLRQTLDRSSERAGTVADEIAYVRACLALESERWGHHLRVSWNVDGAVLQWPMPAFIIQPLVENALKHGLGSRIDGGHVQITVQRDGDDLLVRVEDDGEGFRRNWKDGQGLGNLRQRLQTMYGSRAAMTVENLSSGAAISVRLPGQTG